MTRRLKGPLALAAGAALVTSGVLAAEGEKWSYPVEVWDPPFDMASPRTTSTTSRSIRRQRSGTCASPSRT